MNNNLEELIKKAEENKIAIGHFNFAELTVLKAAEIATKKLKLPIILGTSEGEREFLGVKRAVTLVKNLKAQGLPIFLNADHTKSLEKIKEAVEAGYDAVLFDGSELTLEENIRKTREVVRWVKSHRPDVLVEGELGYIGGSSKLLEAIPEGIEMTSVDDARRFVRETGVDLFAPAVGNIHGMLVNAPEPRLNIKRVKDIQEALRRDQCAAALVLHGASGNSDEDIKAAIQAGISIVHINTEIRSAWRRALADYLKKNPKEIAPYKILASAQEAVVHIIESKLKLFNNLI